MEQNTLNGSRSNPLGASTPSNQAVPSNKSLKAAPSPLNDNTQVVPAPNGDTAPYKIEPPIKISDISEIIEDCIKIADHFKIEEGQGIPGIRKEGP